MTDTERKRPIPPPPPRRAVPKPPDDDELDAAYADTEPPEPSPRQLRSEFGQARKMLVDLLVAGSGGRVDHTIFNGVELDDIERVAAEHGVRPWRETLEDNKRLRDALGAEVVQRYRHLERDDLADL